ncbi:conserved hypothetical protein [Trichinella spiralis]|uniref:hypothetical protein n=1 Tax=Trichinella spiralis TaxID=6334 RepID=UPI0001EFD51D|nr:conserved hypothetical protein [Trichinella spiralis]
MCALREYFVSTTTLRFKMETNFTKISNQETGKHSYSIKILLLLNHRIGVLIIQIEIPLVNTLDRQKQKQNKRKHGQVPLLNNFQIPNYRHFVFCKQNDSD